MINGPELWDLILGDMPEGAVIAGGAVRDYLLGVEPKDIDVFYAWPAPSSEPIDWESIEIFLEPDARVGLHRIDNIYERQEEYEAMTNINLVSSGTMYGFKVDAIELTEMDSAEQLVNGFDFAINQCWYDGFDLYHTGAADDDLHRKTVTLLSNDRRERSLKRFDRFNERHNNAFTFVDII